MVDLWDCGSIHFLIKHIQHIRKLKHCLVDSIVNKYELFFSHKLTKVFVVRAGWTQRRIFFLLIFSYQVSDLKLKRKQMETLF